LWDESSTSLSSGDVVDFQRSTFEESGDERAQCEANKLRHTHSVLFYESRSVFLDNLGESVATSLAAGDAALVVLAEDDHAPLIERLLRRGIDVDSAVLEDRLFLLRAAETLASFIVEGWPEKTLLFKTAEPILKRAKKSAGSNSVLVYGEMVALLWAQGKSEAAIYVEELWSELQTRHPFALRCAYPMSGFAGERHEAGFLRVCELHDRVIPTEDYTGLNDEDGRARLISALQQKALAAGSLSEDREKEIARRKQTESKLQRSENFLTQLLESSEDCLKVLDLEGRLEYMSPLGRKALEIEDITQFLGKYWPNFWKEEDRPRVHAALDTARNGGVGSFRADMPTTKGTPKSWHVRITPVFGFDGKAERLIAVSRDITELERSQQVAVQAEKLAAAGRLAATIAHEINNPLEAVTNLIYLAKSSSDVPEAVCRQLEIADRELARVAQLAQQTLGFYRENSSSKWVSVPDLVNDVLLIYERKLKHKRIELTTAIEAGLEIYGKQGELKQALSNLIANAIEASKIGGRIRLHAWAASRWIKDRESGIRITIADNGAGMSPEVKARVFVPFFTTKPGIGTGIGLWVTKSLIDQHGGFMQFRSACGSGTTMSFFVPNAETVTVPVQPCSA
jgi:PAS domain S-box-containing protein